MDLTRAIELLDNSLGRMKRYQKPTEQNGNLWRGFMRREAWIHMKRSWDLVRVVFLKDPRTRISLGRRQRG